MILVVGSTGMLGREICLQLARHGELVRALTRTTSSPHVVEDLKTAGVEICKGDLKDPNSLARACRGIEAIISTASSTFSRQDGDSIQTVDADGQLSLVAAAKTAGVRRFIFVSFRHPEGMSFPLGDAKLAVEEALRAFDFTVIQASYFMESWLSPAIGFDYPNAKAKVYGTGTSPSSWVSVKDVANMCILALRNPVTERRAIEFGGPEAISPLDAIATFESVMAKRFTVEHVPETAILSQFEASTDPMEKTFAALMLGYCLGDAIAMNAIQAEFGIALTSVHEYAQAVTSKLKTTARGKG